MAITPIDNGAYADDPAAEQLFDAFEKVNSNTGELAARPAHWSGDGEPDDAVGWDGDLYTDLETGDVYRKESGAWVQKLVAGGPPPPPPPP